MQFGDEFNFHCFVYTMFYLFRHFEKHSILLSCINNWKILSVTKFEWEIPGHHLNRVSCFNSMILVCRKIQSENQKKKKNTKIPAPAIIIRQIQINMYMYTHPYVRI